MPVQPSSTLPLGTSFYLAETRLANLHPLKTAALRRSAQLTCVRFFTLLGVRERFGALRRRLCGYAATLVPRDGPASERQNALPPQTGLALHQAPHNAPQKKNSSPIFPVSHELHPTL